MQLTPVQLDAIQEMMNIGVGRAAGALNQMVVRPIRLSIPAIKFGRKEELIEELRQIGSDPLASVRLPFHGAFSGSAFLVFPTQHSEKLVALVTGEDGDVESMNMLKEATFTEIGNIVINGVMGSLTNLLQQKIFYSVPSYAETSLSAIFEQNYFHNAEYILWAEARLTIEGFDAAGDILLLFGIQDLELLRNAVDALIGSVPDVVQFPAQPTAFWPIIGQSRPYNMVLVRRGPIAIA